MFVAFWQFSFFSFNDHLLNLVFKKPYFSCVITFLSFTFYVIYIVFCNFIKMIIFLVFTVWRWQKMLSFSPLRIRRHWAIFNNLVKQIAQKWSLCGGEDGNMSITIAKWFFSTALDGVCLLHIYSSLCDSVNSGDGVYNSQTASGFCRTSHLGGRGSQTQSTGRENDESLYTDVFTQV